MRSGVPHRFVMLSLGVLGGCLTSLNEPASHGGDSSWVPGNPAHTGDLADDTDPTTPDSPPRPDTSPPQDTADPADSDSDTGAPPPPQDTGLPDSDEAEDSSDPDPSPDTGQPVPPPPRNLVISEMMVAPDVCQDPNAQYIEIWNRGASILDLSSGLVATRGGSFTLPPGFVLAPGTRAVLAADAAAFLDCFALQPFRLLSTGLVASPTDDLVQIVVPSLGIVEGARWSAQHPDLLPLSSTAWELDEASLDTYCPAQTPISTSGARGTPGFNNTPCPEADTDTGLPPDTGADSGLFPPADTDTCRVRGNAYGPPTPPSDDGRVAALWGVGWRASLEDGELVDYGFPIGRTAVDWRPPTFVVQLYDPNISFLCRMEFAITNQQPADPSSWSIISGQRFPVWQAWDIELRADNVRTTCPETLTVQPYNGGPSSTINTLSTFAGAWRIGVGETDDIKSLLFNAVTNGGGNWGRDWEPFVFSGFVGDPGSGFELSYGFLFESECQEVATDVSGLTILAPSPPGPPLPDQFVDVRVYRVFSF